MDTEDLMTKDWVSFRGKPVRIEEISRPSQKVCVATSRMVAYPKVSEIEPIPLTTEFLEKNFGEARNGGYFEGDEFYELFIIEVTDGTWIIKLDDVEFSNIPRQQVMVSYVHELQHTLKLCGIDKEIVV